MARRSTRSIPCAAAGFAAGLLIALAVAPAAHAQSASPISPQCRDADTVAGETPLPNVAAALKNKQTLRILPMGSSPIAGRGRRPGGYSALIERLLERAVKGLDVEMINRGVSGELATAAANRIRTEVALNAPDLVLWQVGANDALAYVPLDVITKAVEGTIRWLRAHSVDVILVGLQYVDRSRRDPFYETVRDELRRIAAREHVIIIRRDEAMQVIAQAEDGPLPFAEEFDRSEAGYTCLAEYAARAITLSLFGRGLQRPENPAPQQ